MTPTAPPTILAVGYPPRLSTSPPLTALLAAITPLYATRPPRLLSAQAADRKLKGAFPL